VVRPLLALLALIPLSLATTACTGADAKKAEDLLAQSRTAAQSVSSEGFTMKISMQSDAKSGEVDAQGGMILKGAQAGDFFATVGTAVPGVPTQNVVMVKRGDQMKVQVNGVTRTLPVPASMKMPSTAAGFDVNALTPFVKDVSVSTLDVNGRTEDEITGTLDGNALLSGLPGLSKGMLSSVGPSLGDIKVQLFIPRDTHLVETMLLDMSMHLGKQSVHMSMSYAVTSVNQPLTFPLQ
jgi:hypothetical protein